MQVPHVAVRAGLLAVIALTLTSCTEDAAGPVGAGGSATPQLASQDGSTGSAEEGTLSPALAAANEELRARNLVVGVAMAEWYSVDRAGQTVFANDRAKQLTFHFVAGDPGRGGRTNIQYLVDQSDGAANPGLTSAQTEGAIDAAMETWDGVNCSTIPVVKIADPGVDVDAIDGLFGFGDGIGTYNFGPVVLADIVHGGWLPAGFFDAIAEDGSEFILAVTFTFGFTDADGNFVDQDGDGKLDAAFREIFYNDTFEWGIDVSTDPFDVETVALHEAGHGLSQGHFGKIFITNSNGKLHFAPFAVMNAAISRQAQEIKGTDNGGHCSIWAHWPN